MMCLTTSCSLSIWALFTFATSFVSILAIKALARVAFLVGDGSVGR